MIRHFSSLCVALLLGMSFVCHAGAEPRPLVISTFEFVDTSGEEKDQTQLHAERLQAFMDALQRDMAQNERFTVLPLPTEGSDLTASAKKAGAKLLLTGGIHKMSTLVSWMKADLIDVDSGSVIFDRLYTFRGDTDEAWRRAEAFLAKQFDDVPVAHQ